MRYVESFLSSRTQELIVEGERSIIGYVVSGVPQGSDLGLTLLLIYINDLSNFIKSRVRLFADDTILYSTIRTPSDCEQLQHDLNALET